MASVVQGLTRGLPLLLFFAGFLVFTAEIWEVAVETPTAAFIGLEALLVLLTLVVVIITSLNDLNQQCVFANPTEVRDCALGSEATPSPEVPPDEPFASEVAMFASTAEETRRLQLKGAQRLNALAVLSVYQTLVFVPVIAAAAVVFWAIG